MDVLCAAPTTVVFTPDTPRAPTFLPAPQTRKGRRLVADRGYLALPSMRRVQDEGGVFLIRAKAGRHPQVVEAFREDGNRLRSLRNKPLKAIHAPRPKRQRVELGVRGQRDGCSRRLRLMLSWNPKTKRFCSFLTHRPPKRSALAVVCRA